MTCSKSSFPCRLQFNGYVSKRSVASNSRQAYLNGQEDREQSREQEQRCRNENRAIKYIFRSGFHSNEETTHALGLIDEVDPSLLVVAILTTGARIPVMRLNAEQSASPVPLCGAGNTSGVYAYRTPYIYHVLISNDLRITLRESLRRFCRRQRESVNRA